MAQQTIKASGIREDDGIIKTGATDHTNKRLKVTKVEHNPFGVVKVTGTSRGGKEQTLFRGLAGNLRVVVSR